MPKNRYFKVLSITVILSVTVFFGYSSQKNAKTVADELIKPVGDELSYLNFRFFLFTSNPDFTGPSWYFSYEPKEQMIVAPIGVQVSLLGKVISTEPAKLEKWIKKRSVNK